ncbi:hypothetical protein KIH87_02650 [Paraneptunicella aestuarii]|uniref:type IV toxin-antitoxin system AbiEi family antitoxin n=1 Tax=Paraneptunicella aestuarii TaxID=2831148 RepID=UPI001E473A28|nr:type IV toxin-antitoxin system AbiEi family antitoxin [Paraneptunicella aestuarii]UAA39283.1 hypothetical protein KIH87_02650 [Paraneptunicella aestuarii]
MLEQQELIEKAVGQLNQQTGLKVDYRLIKNSLNDGELILSGINHSLPIECKKWLSKNHVQKLTEQLNQKSILIADYINPNLAVYLKELQVQFLDVAGNAYINQPPVYIDIQGKKPEKSPNEVAMVKQLGKAFQPKGMKVVFMLLAYPELTRAPMRTIAEAAEVALGTVKQVIDDLIYQGFIIQKGQHQNELANRSALLEKWLAAYPTSVEAKLSKDVYFTDNPELLKSLKLEKLHALWGGEYAVEKYDNYLNAKDYLIYVNREHKNEVLKAARLRRAKHEELYHHNASKVILVEPLLSIDKIEDQQHGLAHPLLVYANLVASFEPRNIDAARRFYENYIA